MTYNCDTCEEKSQTKVGFIHTTVVNSDPKHHQGQQAIQNSSAKTKCYYCADDTCDSCLSYWLDKAKEISMGLAISKLYRTLFECLEDTNEQRGITII